jgi:integrase
MQYLGHIKSLKSKWVKYKGKPLASGSISKRLQAVERCYTELRDTQYGFAHPWPESSATALSGYTPHGKPKTEIIPDEVLAPLFQHANTALASAPELLHLQSLLEEFVPQIRNKTHNKERSTFLQSHGWTAGVHEFNKSILELRDCCLLIILLTTGIRVHELCNFKRDNWYSEVRDGERFYFIGSKSEKTDEGDTHWLCPEIAIDALKVLGDLALPMQSLLEQQLNDAQREANVKEAARLQRFSGSVVLAKIANQFNKVSVLSGGSVNDGLQKIVNKLGLTFNLASHMFRRTFAVYVVHHKLGDLRYLRDHFKHWSLEMTILYAMNDKQDLELYDEIYAAFDNERQGIIGHWLEPDTPLSGGLASQIRNLRDKDTPTRTYKSRAAMIEHLSEQIYIRSTGLAWCTNDDGSCAGGL